MEEKERKKRLEKQELERYNARLEAEAAEYNPWGKGGGGAPMRDNQGKIVGEWAFKLSHPPTASILQEHPAICS